nr:immunoglobulin heavy chain junction region [Macaca mulatta]MOV55483.1 immunoglobulin heavy chain junction region [Macaca mulatta]MOV58036.1 immunoglobulin heavy chain junction region [Macaca mulatta]MOV59387.1 immunoglobulin heavy chain junction region [Macaca mulatta]
CARGKILVGTAISMAASYFDSW